MSGKSLRVAVVVLAVVVVAAIGGGVWWYVKTPHTAEAQFAYAEKLDKTLQGDALTKGPAELQPQINETVEQYRRVGTRFGPSPKAAEGLQRVATVHEKISKDRAKAMGVLEEVVKAYPDEEHAGAALLEQARLLKADATELKNGGKAEAVGKFKEALDKLAEYRKQFATGKQAGEALMETGRIWQDNIEEPLIKSIETFEQVLKEYARTEHEAEAMYRLAKAYEKAREFERALTLYTQLLELHPKSKWEADALFAKGKILADQMDKHDEAAQEFQKMAQNFPDDPRAEAAAGEAKDQMNKAAEDQSKDYGKTRYGGNVPFDTSADKALPPADMLKQFTVQKLDALTYDLNVEFTPGEHRITVNGTLTVANKGADKKELLLMLGPGLNLTSLTVDGAKAESKHTAETLKVLLPVVFKKDATATLAFSYTGQYADAKAMASLSAGPGGGTRGAKATTKPTTKPATTSATNPTTNPATNPAAGPTTAPMGEDELAAAAPATTVPSAGNGPPLTMDPQMGLGEFGYALSGASWYPVTIIGDVFDAHVTLKTPGAMEAVCNGALVKRDKPPVRAGSAGTTGTATFEFQTKTPVFGLYFAYGPYTMQDSQVGPIHFYTYMRPANASKHQAYVEVTNKILSFYASRLNGFPYEKMAIVDTPLPPFLGGVGPASLMFLQGAMVDPPGVPETLLAHELAHQWFGNLIPINITDPNYNQWLSEGFATYFDALYTEFKDGPAPFKQHIERYHQLFFQFIMTAPPGSGVISKTFSPMLPGYRPLVYEKGALVLHMLRKVTGDEKFFQILRRYVEQYQNKQSTVDDFRRLASEVHGEDLSWFFAEWLDQSIYARWKVTAEVVPATPASAGAPPAAGPVKTRLMITQPDNLVKMVADITLIGPNDEHQRLPNVMFDKKENPVEATTPFTPVKVIIDEENWVLKRPGSDNIWTAPKSGG